MGWDAFVIPDFSAPLDVDAAIARTPTRITCKGMFNTSIASAVLRIAPSREEDLFAGTDRRRWAPFLEYPLRAHMRLLTNAARIRFAGAPIREGLRRLGWTAYSTFSESMAGKVVLEAMGVGIDAVFRVSGRAISLTISEGEVTAIHVGERHWRFEFKDLYCFPDCYHVGIVEGVLRVHGQTGDVRMQLLSPTRGALDARW